MNIIKISDWFKSYTDDYSTQKEAVLSHLERGKPITQLEATKDYGILRLSAIIHNLRKEGMNIKTVRKASKKCGTYAEYTLDRNALSCNN